MIPNPYSWTMTYQWALDFPTQKLQQLYNHLIYKQLIMHISSFARIFMQWFVDHQEYLRNPFYVGGDSYEGRVVPVITQIIAIKNEMEIKPFINLKGYLLGNPLTFEGEQNYLIPFAYGMGLISDELYESLKTNCKGEYHNIDPSNTLCLQDSNI